MDAGFKFMNDLVVRQAAQGWCRYIPQYHSDIKIEDLKARGIVIGHDHRHNSAIFARITAEVFLSEGYVVHLFSELVATPLVPFAIVRKNCVAGVMVTASHNPKEDNGYKVYWGNGSQIIPPHDAGIETSILNNLQPWRHVAPFDPLHASLRDPYQDMVAAYMTECTSKLCWTHEANAAACVPITYSAMHGVGAPFVDTIFESFGLPPVLSVSQQRAPDPDFKTVAFPNPEEGKGALALAISTATEKGSITLCSLLFAPSNLFLTSPYQILSLSFFLFLSVCLSVCLSVSQSVSLLVCLSVSHCHPSLFYDYAIYLCTSNYFSVYVYLFSCQFLSTNVCISEICLNLSM
jgi:phosphomannomutase